MNKLEIINTGLTNAGKAPLVSLDEGSEIAKVAEVQYQSNLEELLSMAPWNFSTKRALLVRLDETPVESYRYLYEIPSDVHFIWDIYNKSFSVDGVNYFERGARYSQIPYPLIAGYTFLDKQAEVIGGRIASNFSSLSIFYTPKRKFDVSHSNPQFQTILKLQMEKSFLKYRGVSEERLGISLNETTGKERKNIAATARENIKALKSESPTIIQNLRLRRRGI